MAPRSSLMYRVASKQQRQLRKAMATLRLAKKIIEFKRPEVYEYTDREDDLKDRFTKACKQLGVE